MLFQSVLEQSKHCIRSLNSCYFLPHAIHSIFLQNGKMLCELHFIGLYLPLSVAQLNNFDSQSTLNCSAFKLNLKHFFQFSFISFCLGMELMLFNDTLFPTVSPTVVCGAWVLLSSSNWNMMIERYCVRCIILDIPVLSPTFKWILRPLQWKPENKCYSSNFVISNIHVHLEWNSDAFVDCFEHFAFGFKIWWKYR